METTLTPSQIRHERLNSLLTKYQDAGTKRDYYKDRADSMAVVLDLDPQKYSSTILNWRGENMQRVDLQRYQIDNSNNAITWAGNYVQFKKDYDDYFIIVKELDKIDFMAANPTLAPQLAEISATQATNTAIGTAQAKATETAAIAKTQLEAQTATFAAKNKQMILYVGIGLTIIIVAMFVYFKFKGKAKP